MWISHHESERKTGRIISLSTVVPTVDLHRETIEDFGCDFVNAPQRVFPYTPSLSFLGSLEIEKFLDEKYL